MMKSLLISLLLLSGAANSYQLQWEESLGADGYLVVWSPFHVLAGEPSEVDVGINTSLDLSTLGLLDDVRYVFQVYAYAGAPKSYSSPSDAIHWTKEPPPEIIEMPEAPKQLIIFFGEPITQ